jgi:hypothetical protein
MDRRNGVCLEYSSSCLHSAYSQGNQSIPLSGFVLTPKESMIPQGVRGKKKLESEAGVTSWITCSLYMSLQRTQSIQPFLGNRPRKHVNSAINTLLTQACPRPDSNQFTPRGTSSCRSVMSSAHNFEPQYIRQGKSSRPRHRVPIILSHSVPVNPPSVIRSGWYKCDKTTIRHEDYMV